MNTIVIASITFSLNAAFAALLLFLVALFAARASRVNRNKVCRGLISGALICAAGVAALLLAGATGLAVVAWAGILVGCFGLGLFTGTASLAIV